MHGGLGGPPVARPSVASLARARASQQACALLGLASPGAPPRAAARWPSATQDVPCSDLHRSPRWPRRATREAERPRAHRSRVAQMAPALAASHPPSSTPLAPPVAWPRRAGATPAAAWLDAELRPRTSRSAPPVRPSSSPCVCQLAQKAFERKRRGGLKMERSFRLANGGPRRLTLTRLEGVDFGCRCGKGGPSVGHRARA